MVRLPGCGPPGPEAGEGLLSEILGPVAVTAEQPERPDQPRIQVATDLRHLCFIGHGTAQASHCQTNGTPFTLSGFPKLDGSPPIGEAPKP